MGLRGETSALLVAAIIHSIALKYSLASSAFQDTNGWFFTEENTYNTHLDERLDGG